MSIGVLRPIAFSVFVLVSSVRAGENGCQPPDGTYTFKRGNPPSGSNAGAGKFDAGSPSTLTVNPGPTEQVWVLGSDGQYRPQPSDGRSICFHDGSPITYEYKLDGDVVSTGYLSP